MCWIKTITGSGKLSRNKHYNMYRMNLFLFSLLMAACSKGEPSQVNNTVSSHTYYVSPAGNDAGAGTLNAPFRAINTALGKAVAGDTVIVRKGIYYEKVAFPKSGRLEKLITLKAYNGEIPVIDGTGLSITGTEALVTISNVSYIVLEG